MHETTYIYKLVDPRDDSVHYIGQSVNPVLRYSGHVSPRGGSTWKMKLWVRDLFRGGVLPLMQIIEAVDESDPYERELYWINKMFADGQPLLNQCGATRPWQTKSRR